MTTRDTLSTLARAVRCEAQYGAVPDARITDDWQRQAHNYRVRLTYRLRRITIDFFMGPALTKEPDAAGVLDCLLSDCEALDRSFEDWCGDFGYDTDSRKAERTYRACLALGKKLRRLLGADFDRFRSADRN